MTEPNRDSTYPLTGLHCNACVGRVSKALMPLASSVTVSLSPMQVVLTDTSAGFDALRAAVENAGKYTLLPPLAPDSGSNQELNKAVAQLIREQAAPKNIVNEVTPPSWLTTYSPLLLIVAYIFGGSVLLQVGLGGWDNVTTQETMRYFMAGFFLVFSFFKLLDIRAFADAYQGYDLLAERWRGWALLYPFVEQIGRASCRERVLMPV